MKKNHQPLVYNSLTRLNKDLGLPQPLHPLITISDLNECTGDLSELALGAMLNFYLISLKKSFSGSIRYGQHYYDYDGGGLSFVAPNQLMGSNGDEDECEGLTLMIHPDFLKHYPLAGTIKSYGFFSYLASEALHLSGKEQEIISVIFINIRQELEQRLDHFSQNIIISQLESLLNYSDRFYSRQFLTRKPVNNDLLSKMESLLEDYFSKNNTLKMGLPSVQYLAEHLTLSPSYLSDMLRILTGLNAQQHIHQKMIEKAKEHLAMRKLTVAEIAYQLGFEHPQSFSKVFKKKTNLSPQEYRRSILS